MSEATAAAVWTYPRLIALLENNAKALEQAILTINARQTEDERASNVTRHQNGRGWNGRDAEFGGSLATWIERGTLPRDEGGYGKQLGATLTPRQRQGALRMVRKYWRQLLEEIALKGGQVSYKGGGKKEPAPATAPAPLPDVSAPPTEVGFEEPDF